ncbi:UNVERIFIED_CONTAM: hypothetical protein GTU68_015872 [Idotea baltica]|nr:hypothetical protein [Idotea baltica]
MNKRLLGLSGLEVSEIAFGCMSLRGEQTANIELLHKAHELGINFFDTADLYDKGENEITVGKAFKDRRDQVIIATKVGNQWRPDGSGWDWNPSKSYILSAVEASLKRLQTDYIDLYQLHGGTIEDPIDETIEAFELLKERGLIRQYGISSIRQNVVREYIQRSNITSVMTQYSLLDRRPEAYILPALEEAGIGVVVRGAVSKGLLAGKPATEYLGHSEATVEETYKRLQYFSQDSMKPSQLALRYALGGPAITTIAAGASNFQQLSENAAAGSLPSLDPTVRNMLSELVPTKTYQQHL